MNKFIALASILSVVVGASAAHAGRLDAPEEIIRNPAVHINIEAGYLTDAEKSVRGGGKDTGGHR